MERQQIAESIDRQEEDRYSWLQQFLSRKAIPFIKRRAVTYYVREHRSVLIVDRRQHMPGIPLIDSDGDEIDPAIDVYSIVSYPHPEISITWYYTVKEAHDHALTLGLMPYIHI